MSLSKDEQLMLDLLIKKQGSKKKVHVIQVLDRSGSMVTGIEQTIGMYNENLSVTRATDLETTVTFISFSSKVDELTIVKRHPKEVPLLTTASYVPSGYTALYDAIGYALDTAESFPDSKDPNVSFLLQIMTDGEENQSRIYNAATLKTRISALNESGRWTITVMGPHGSIDLFTKNLGVLRGNVATFNASSVHSRSMAKGATVASTQQYFGAIGSGAGAVMDSYASIAPDGNVDNIAKP